MGCSSSKGTAASPGVITAVAVAQTDLKSEYDVVVIGGGIAGIAAARKIVDSRPQCRVVILEAGARLGGRLYTEPSFLGRPSGAADMGASWIHGGGPENPVRKLANRLGARLAETDSDNYTYYRSDGKKADEDEADAAYKRWEELHEKAKEAGKELRDDGKDDKPIGKLLASIDEEVLAEPLVQAALVDALEFQYGASIKLLSSKHGDEDSQFEGPEMVWVDGYTTLPTALVNGTLTIDGKNGRPLDIALNSKVTDVEQHEGSTNITVKLATGKSISAKHVICAVPLGVLKNDVITFEPHLSNPKAAAIESVGFGNVVKMSLMFEEAFWGDKLFFQMTCPPGTDPTDGPVDETHRGMFRLFLNTTAVSGKPTLITFAIGAAADVAEEHGQEWCVETAYRSLKTMFDDEASRPVKALASRWRSNPCAYGAYPFLQVGSSPEDVEALGEAEFDGHLSFCGDHTNMEYIGTCHGAYLSGLRAADEYLALGNRKGSGESASEVRAEVRD